MNALPVKDRPLHTALDDLFAAFGVKSVLLAIMQKAILRPFVTKGTDALPGSEVLPDHLRSDIGLPPMQERTHIDLLSLTQRDMWGGKSF